MKPTKPQLQQLEDQALAETWTRVILEADQHHHDFKYINAATSAQRLGTSVDHHADEDHAEGRHADEDHS